MHCAGEHPPGSQEQDLLLPLPSITAGVSGISLGDIKVSCMLCTTDPTWKAAK